MQLNQKISKIPFLWLYGIAALFYILPAVNVFLFQKNILLFAKDQPWDFLLAGKLAELFDLPVKEGFLLAIPVVLVFLFIIIKAVGRLVNLDKKTNIKGDNYIAAVAILFMLPNFVFSVVLFFFRNGIN